MRNEVWVTGAGAVCAQGLSLPEIWDRMISGKCRGPSSPSRLAGYTDDALSHPAFCLPDEAFAGDFRHSARDTLALAVLAGREALGQSGAPNDCAVCLGSTAGNALHFLREYGEVKNGRPAASGNIADFFACSPANALAEELRLRGTAVTVGNACCSGTDAVGLGWQWIRSGMCERVLAGGTDALSIIPYIGFRRLMIYSDEPCRPFDRGRKGLNLGEGAGMLLLESAESAQKRGARPLARLLGYGSSADAHHLTAPHPEGRGLERAMRTALLAANVPAACVGLVNAHGTSTPDNDRIEGRTIRRVFPEARLWASKGATGHTLGAAGGLEAAMIVTALSQEAIPGSPGFTTIDSEIGVEAVRRRERYTGHTAVSVSLGFGGGNAALVFGKAKIS